MRIRDIEKLKPNAVRELLIDLMEQLDELDLEDFFGTEGWRHRFGWED